MKAVKSLRRQIELAAANNLFIMSNGNYLRVDVKCALDMQGVAFYTNEKIKNVVVDQKELKRLYKRIAELQNDRFHSSVNK